MRNPQLDSFTFSRHALQEIDRRCVEFYRLPVLALMENAGRAVAERALRSLKKNAGALILTGPGNNGGDALVAARHLHNAAIPVTILLLAPRDQYRNAAAAQLAIVDAMKLPVETLSENHAEFRDWHVESPPDHLIIDGLFGTGLSPPVTGPAADLILAANHSHRKILAIDIPSGLDADTGNPLGTPSGIAIIAAETISFCGKKRGFTPAAKKFTGEITTADIGAPLELLTELADQNP